MPTTFAFRPARTTVPVRLRVGPRHPDPHKLADTYRHQFAAAFLEAVRTLNPDRARLARGLGTANVDEAMASINTDAFAPALAAAYRPIVEAVMAAKGQWTLANRVPVPLRKADQNQGGTAAGGGGLSAAGNDAQLAQMLLSFNLDNPYAITAAQTVVGDLITAVSEAQIDSVRGIIAQSITDGLAPARSSRLITNVVGLDNQRAQQLTRFEAGLVANGIPPERIEKLVAGQYQKLLRDRAMLIARTETINASVAGTQAAFAQAVRAGLLNPLVVGQQWIATEDDRTCSDCTDVDGDVVPFGQLFANGSDGPTLHPGCRCDVGIADLPDDQVAAAASAFGDAGDDGAGYDGTPDLSESEVKAMTVPERADYYASRVFDPGSVDAAAQDLIHTATLAEKGVDADLRALIERLRDDTAGRPTQSELAGYEYHLKTFESLSRKIGKDLSEHPDRTLEGVADGMHDSLRYTITARPGELHDVIVATRADLASKGYTEYALKNSWLDGNPYKGINGNWRDPQGRIFELQFHTPQSFYLKGPTGPLHPLYEIQRKLDKTKFDEWVQWHSLDQQMRVISGAITEPPASALMDIGTLKFFNPPYGAYGLLGSEHLANAEIDALIDWVNIGYKDVGRLLRGVAAGRYDRATVERIQAMDEMMMRSTVAKQTEVFRGIRHDPSELFTNLSADPASWVGNEIKDAGYMATTTDREYAGAFARDGGWVMDITLPAGSNALDVSSLLGINQEAEILLAHGSHFYVTAVDVATHTLHLTMIP